MFVTFNGFLLGVAETRTDDQRAELDVRSEVV